jgi:5'-3' exonuclease
VESVAIWTPDKDLAQCVSGDRVVQIDRRTKKIRNAEGVREKFGVDPALIPDFLALVGDAADGYPGIAGIGAVSAARLLNRHGADRRLSPGRAGGRSTRDGLLFKKLATLRTDASAISRCRRAAVARPDERIRLLGKAHRSAASCSARAQGRARNVISDR